MKHKGADDDLFLGLKVPRCSWSSHESDALEFSRALSYTTPICQIIPKYPLLCIRTADNKPSTPWCPWWKSVDERAMPTWISVSFLKLLRISPCWRRSRTDGENPWRWSTKVSRWVNVASYWCSDVDAHLEENMTGQGELPQGEQESTPTRQNAALGPAHLTDHKTIKLDVNNHKHFYDGELSMKRRRHAECSTCSRWSRSKWSF